MFAEDNGEGLVGRTVAWLKHNADDFGVLLPHCDNDYAQRILPSYH